MERPEASRCGGFRLRTFVSGSGDDDCSWMSLVNFLLQVANLVLEAFELSPLPDGFFAFSAR
jgi:hypothetical protein